MTSECQGWRVCVVGVITAMLPRTMNDYVLERATLQDLKREDTQCNHITLGKETSRGLSRFAEVLIS